MKNKMNTCTCGVIIHPSATRCKKCHIKHRQKTGWFTTPEMKKTKRGSVTRSLRTKIRIPLYKTENDGKHSIPWHGIYTRAEFKNPQLKNKLTTDD